MRETTPGVAASPGSPDRGVHAALAVVILLCTGAEAALLISDLVGQGGGLRRQAYDYGGFWPGLLYGWRPNYAAQPYAMFLTHAFLHGGPLHLAVNMVTLWSLGRGVGARVGAGGLLLLYTGAALGGAGGYGLLAQSVRPMVGASGALFGLAGGLMAWAYVDRYTARAGLWPVIRVGLFLLAMNVVMWWALDGQLAWQTHLGGFLTGWVLALLIDPTSRV